jgi:hypothetical protein
MIAQSVAETIAGKSQNRRILYLSLNGRESTEYVREAPASIDTIKNHISNKMINGRDFLRTCKCMNNLYMLAGISNELEERHYYPEMSIYLLEEVSPEFDIVIADCGNNIDNGLAVGALTVSKEILYVITQQESVLKRCEKLNETYRSLGLEIAAYLANKYDEQDPYSLTYLADRLHVEKEHLWKIESAGYARQAEMEYKTLLEYKNEKFIKDILEISNHILNKSGYEIIEKPRKSKWKSFI